MRILDSFYNNLIAEERYRMILDGLQVTLIITLGAMLLGTLLGGVICRMRMSRHKWLQKLAKWYIDIMRGTPVLVVLMLMYYVILAPLNATGIVVAIITFGMNAAAYIGEMLRTGIEGIDKGQTEAGLALGYTPSQTFLRIVLPQVVRSVIPVYQGEVVSLLKGTSIVGYIAVADMTRASDLIRSRTFDAFFPLIVTHEMTFAHDVSTRIFFMSGGYIHEDGSPSQIFEAPVHSATKAFIRRIRKEVFEVDGPDYDVLGMYSQMGAFCHKYNIEGKLEGAIQLCGKMLGEVLAAFRPLTVRITHSEMSGESALDFMAMDLQETPLTDAQRSRLSGLCRQLVEEPTALGFRVRLVL